MTSDGAVTQPADVAGVIKRLLALRSTVHSGAYHVMTEAAALLAHHEAQERRIAELEAELQWIEMFAVVRSGDSQRTAAKVQRGAMTTIAERARALINPIKDNSDAQ